MFSQLCSCTMSLARAFGHRSAKSKINYALTFTLTGDGGGGRNAERVAFHPPELHPSPAARKGVRGLGGGPTTSAPPAGALGELPPGLSHAAIRLHFPILGTRVHASGGRRKS